LSLNFNGKLNLNYPTLVHQKSKIVQWVCHEDAYTLHTSSQYDMIIGTDQLSELGFKINFNTQRIMWEGVEIPMKEKHIISNLQNVMAIYYRSIKSMVL
jgi:hypothetical protein